MDPKLQAINSDMSEEMDINAKDFLETTKLSIKPHNNKLEVVLLQLSVSFFLYLVENRGNNSRFGRKQKRYTKFKERFSQNFSYK